MSFGCLMITTNRPDRLGRTCNALDSVEQFADNFDQKVLSIDLLPEVDRKSGCQDILKGQYSEKGWEVVVGECTGHRAMQNNILRGLEKVETEFLFYCEDHVIVEQIPPILDVQTLLEVFKYGWINFNTHVHEENLLNVPGFVEKPGREGKLDWVNDPINWTVVRRGNVLLKDLPISDEYLLNFPAAITKKNIFESLLMYGMDYCKDVGIEVGFTQAWHGLEFDLTHAVGILAKSGTKARLPFETFQELHNQACMRFRNNDPTMLHKSIIAHQSMPKEKGMRRSFF